jgi:hypothetical protein
MEHGFVLPDVVLFDEHSRVLKRLQDIHDNMTPESSWMLPELNIQIKILQKYIDGYMQHASSR